MYNKYIYNIYSTSEVLIIRIIFWDTTSEVLTDWIVLVLDFEANQQYWEGVYIYVCTREWP
jgi:hypothetical protein